MTLAGFIYVQVNALFPSDLLEMNSRADAISENLESSWNFFEFYLSYEGIVNFSSPEKMTNGPIKSP